MQIWSRRDGYGRPNGEIFGAYLKPQSLGWPGIFVYDLIEKGTLVHNAKTRIGLGVGSVLLMTFYSAPMIAFAPAAG